MTVLNKASPISRFAFGSCSKQNEDQPAWGSISKLAPNFYLWLGDAVYADHPVFLTIRKPASLSDLEESYLLQSQHKAYRNFSSEFPILGVYDDHDYGMNNGDKSYLYRNESMKLFLDFIHEPIQSKRRLQNDGIYASYVLGKAPNLIKLILLDIRTSKDPYSSWGASKYGDFLGTRQWEWLEKELNEKDGAVFTFIGTSIQFISQGDLYVSESWARFPTSKAKLLSLMALSNRSGIVLLSGDVHFAEINRYDSSVMNYPLYDFTSSGLTHSWSGVIKKNLVKYLIPNIARVGAFYEDRNFGDIEIHWSLQKSNSFFSSDKIDAQNTKLVYSIRNIYDGSSAISINVSLDELSPKFTWNATSMDHLVNCKSSNASELLTPSCSFILETLQPHPTVHHSIGYVLSHSVLLLMALGIVSFFTIHPLFVILYKRPYSQLAVHALLFALFVAFIQSIP
jgi:alkaline phosphatase D